MITENQAHVLRTQWFSTSILRQKKSAGTGFELGAVSAKEEKSAFRPRFRLLRYFSITSLIGVLAVVVGLLFFYRSLAFHALMDHETRSNVALTRVFANNIWPHYSSFILNAGHIDPHELPKQTELTQLREEVQRLMKGLNVVKVKIYNLEGLTVYSTDLKQIGGDESKNAGFLSAKNGGTASDITFRHRFDSFEQIISDRNLVSSYIPIRKNETMPVEGVFELYSDVSELVEKLEKTQWQIAAAVLGSLSLLYFFLFLIVRRADEIISEQSEEERLANQEKLHYQAFHDSLTGLPNRAKFAELLDETIRHAKRNETIFAILFVDLDHFKYLNDSLGHLVGDQLLREVGERLRQCVRETDTVARLGGDEFIILLPQIGRIDHAARAAEKIRSAVSGQRYHIEGQELAISPSIGISIYPYDGEDAVALIKNADAAMYYAKEMGRDKYQFFTPDMNARALAVLSMERSLRQAVEQNEFLLHYQPQMDIATGSVVGMEALIRWPHPVMGMVSPAEFIPVAEERGLILPIGDWVLREACRQNRAWQDAGMSAIPVAVNVSALQFRQPDFPEKVAKVLRDTGLAPEYLELEITEGVIMHGAEAAIETLRKLKAMRIMLSIDDFGTGYSSLSYLKQFRIDRLKLDQSFVRGLPSDMDDAAITTAVLGMAKALKLKVIAEGVETREQLEFLRLWECDEAQGYGFSKPLPTEDLDRFVRQKAPPKFAGFTA